MPSSEDIIKQFRESFANGKNSRTPVEIEVMVLGLQDLINEGDKTAIANKAYALLRENSDSPFGAAVCQVLLNKPDGVNLAANVGRNIMRVQANEINNQGDAEKFLRENSATSAFSKEFITQTSPEYVNNIRVKALEIARKYGVIPRPGQEQGFVPLDKKSPDEIRVAMVAMGQEMKALASNIDDLTDVSKQYLGGLHAGIMDDSGMVGRLVESGLDEQQARAVQQGVSNKAINDSCALRFVMSQLTVIPELMPHKTWVNSASYAQRSFNYNDKTPEEVLRKQIPSAQVYNLVTGKQIPEFQDELYVQLEKEKQALEKQLKEAQELGQEVPGLKEKVEHAQQQFGVKAAVVKGLKEEEAINGMRPVVEGIHSEEGREGVNQMIRTLKSTPPVPTLDIDFNEEFEESLEQRNLVAQERLQSAQTIIAREKARGYAKELGASAIRTAAGKDLAPPTNRSKFLSDLDKPALGAAIRKQVEAEFCGENLRFHEQAERLRNAAADPQVSVEALRHLAKQIKSEHLDPGSQFEINIGYEIRNPIFEKDIDTMTKEQLGEWLDRADQELVNLLQEGPYANVQKTEGWKRAQEAERGLEKIKALETRLDKLKNPTLGDRFTALFQGGIDKVRQKAIDEIDKTKMEVQMKMDPEGFAQLQKQNQASVKQLNRNRADALDYRQAEQMVQAIDRNPGTIGSMKAAGLDLPLTTEQQKAVVLAQALGNTGLGSGGDGDSVGLTQEQNEAVLRQREMALGVMQVKGPGAREHLQSREEVASLHKNLSVREALASDSHTEQHKEGHKQSNSHHL